MPWARRWGSGSAMHTALRRSLRCSGG
jgi:hypothetical protein